MADDVVESPLNSLLTRHPVPRVISIGRSIFDPIWREKEHAGRNSELLHVLRGSVDLVMRSCTLHGEEGDTLYTPARALHRDVFPPQTTFEAYLVHFEWSGEPELLSRVTLPQMASVRSVIKAQVASDFRALYQAFERQSPLARELAGLRLLAIILTLAGEAGGTQVEPTDLGEARRMQIMRQARQHIQQHYHEPLGLDDIAAALHISPYHLSHVFSAQSGFTLSSYLTSVRMEKAAELMRQGRMPIRAVARAVGYRDAQYFGRVFRAHFGAAPSRYRVQR